MDHNAVKEAKNICCVKDEGAVDLITVSRWFKKFYSGCKNLNKQAGSSRLKIMAFKK